MHHFFKYVLFSPGCKSLPRSIALVFLCPILINSPFNCLTLTRPAIAGNLWFGLRMARMGPTSSCHFILLIYCVFFLQMFHVLNTECVKDAGFRFLISCTALHCSYSEVRNPAMRLRTCKGNDLEILEID